MYQLQHQPIKSEYHSWLISILSDADEASAYLEEALEAYEQDGNKDALLYSLNNIAVAQGLN